MGFTVLGNQIVDPSTKSSLRAGDQLVLSKPLGTGVILAALMQAKMSGEFYPPLLQKMLVSNQVALELAQREGVSAITDVTGFGLAGHLLETLNASKLGAEVELERIPALDGAVELVKSGIESTLTAENLWRESQVAVSNLLKEKALYRLLFDPQTCGGLLLGVRPDEVSNVIETLQNAGFDDATAIGRVTDEFENLRVV